MATRPRARPPKPTAETSPPAAITVRPLAPTDFPAIEELFGERGACGGCWCMFWRAPSRAAFAEIKGDRARRQFRELVTSGKARGVLAFEGERPVGWCAFGPRADFPMTERKRGYVVADAAEVWSVNCFFIRKDRRSQGIARRLLAAAADEARAAGAATLEGYPVPLARGVTRPGAFVYTGTLSMFESAGFRVTQRLLPGSPLVRLALLSPRKKGSRPRAAP